MPQAWALLEEQLPTVDAYRPIVAIVDSGVDLTPPDLSSILVPGFNSVGIGRAQIDGGAVDDIGTTGHGTRCAGVSVASVNNGIGIAGVASRARHMPIRCTDNPGGSALLSDILNGVRWAADNGADVISVSYWGVDNPTVQTSAIYARERGSVVLWAAGNSGRSCTRVNNLWPVLVVGATNRADDRLASSTFGSLLDLAAPGEAMLTTARGGLYTTSSGTSFATPMAAGVAAMIRAASPGMPPDRVAEILVASVDDLGPAGRDDVFGAGRVNVLRAVSMALADSTRLPPTAAPLVGSGWLVRAVAAADGSLPTGAMFGQAMPASSRPIRQSRINASMLNLPASSSGFVALRVEGLVRIESPEASANAGTAAGAVEFEISGFGPAELRVAGSLVASLSAPTHGSEQIPSTTSGRLTLAPGWHRLELLSLAQTPESLGGTRTISIRMSERTDWSPTLISGNRIGFVRAPADIADSAAVPGSDGRIDDGDYLAFSQAFAAGIAMADIADSDAVPGPDGAVDSGDLTLFFLSFSEQTSP
ncbi:MAG: S8 family serine peptidase [Phycisphaerales bacterium]